MSTKKKKKKEPAASASAEVVAERDDHEEQDALDDTNGLPSEATDTASSNAADAHAAEAHGDGGHGHGGHDPVEDDRPRNGLIVVMTLISCVTMIVLIVFVRELFNT